MPDRLGGQRVRRMGVCGAVLWLAAAPAAAAQSAPPPAAQNPSPMADATRIHARLVERLPAGQMRTLPGPGDKPIALFIPERAATRTAVDLLIHWHGAGWLPAQAAAGLTRPTVSAAMTLGSGSGVYDRTYRDPAPFDSLLAQITRELSAARGAPVRIDRIWLSGWSAGHGAIRRILLVPRHVERISGVLLIDGMHTSYVLEGQVLASGGALDTTNLVALTAFARAATRGDRRMIVTHSEIFPGTFASTTETAEWMLASLGVKRRPVLRWGPRGMQQLSEAHAGRFTLMGFAGNSAPDHVDQLHALPELLKQLVR
ncbi:MAG: hypothetical protein K2R93_21960 [Gemmatimonadaceae bacterium]|nr:hypothetical protein [Gemmatimonadaceae bacterium]